MRDIHNVCDLQTSRTSVFVDITRPYTAALARIAILFEDIRAHFLTDGTRDDGEPVNVLKHILAGFEIGSVKVRSYLVAQFFPKLANASRPRIRAVAYRFSKRLVIKHLADMLKKVRLSPS